MLTILAGLLGAFIQRRGETARWLREERLKAYTEHLLVTDRMMGALIAREDPTQAVGDPHLTEVRQSIALCQLLGPESLYDAAAAFQDAVYVAGNYRGTRAEPGLKRIETRKAFIAEARTALGVK